MSDRGGNVHRFPGTASSRPEPLRPRYAGDIEGPPPPPRWVVDGILLPGAVTLFAGAPDVGKSLVSLQMLVAIALGREWLGRATEQARCLAVFCEDAADRIDGRCLNICGHYEVHNSVLEHELAWECRSDRETLLWETEYGKGRPTKFFEDIFGGENTWPRNGLVGEQGFRVILLDTAAAIFDGNHNSTAQVSAFMRALTRAAIRHGCAIVMNTHTAKNDRVGFGGSGQWSGAARAAFNVARPKPPPGVDEEEMQYGDFGLQRVFTTIKSNYTSRGRPERWRWAPPGIFVLDELAGESRRQQRKITESDRIDIRYRLLMCLKWAMQRGIQVPADPLAQRSLPNLARVAGSSISWVPFNELYLATDALIESGQVVRVAVKGRCLLRPVDGPGYAGEEPWVL